MIVVLLRYKKTGHGVPELKKYWIIWSYFLMVQIYKNACRLIKPACMQKDFMNSNKVNLSCCLQFNKLNPTVERFIGRGIVRSNGHGFSFAISFNSGCLDSE
jgi:hypothetical protein